MADQSNEMVERVARALAPHIWDETSGLYGSRSWVNGRQVALTQASAAIEAMATPTDVMVEAAVEEYEFTDEVVTRIYTAAIDAALQEKPPAT